MLLRPLKNILQWPLYRGDSQACVKVTEVSVLDPEGTPRGARIEGRERLNAAPFDTACRPTQGAHADFDAALRVWLPLIRRTIANDMPFIAFCLAVLQSFRARKPTCFSGGMKRAA